MKIYGNIPSQVKCGTFSFRDLQIQLFFINNLSRDPTFSIKKTHVWIFIQFECIDNGEFHTGEISKSTIGR